MKGTEKKMNLSPKLTPYIKIHSKWMVHLKIKKTVKLLKRKSMWPSGKQRSLKYDAENTDP